MSAKAMPQKETGVYRRPGSTNWQLRVKAPKDLAHLYPSGIAWRGSLNTADLRVANSLALAKRAELDKRFADQRTELRAEKVAGFTPALIHELAARVAAFALEADERLRTDPETAQTVLAPVALAVARAARSGLTIGKAAPSLPSGFVEPADPWTGMPADVAATLAGLNEAASAAAAEDWASHPSDDPRGAPRVPLPRRANQAQWPPPISGARSCHFIATNVAMV